MGEVTSATRSPILGRNIALARVDVGYRAPGTALEIGKLDGQQKRLPARVVAFPHFDPTKERVKGDYGAGRVAAPPPPPPARAGGGAAAG